MKLKNNLLEKIILPIGDWVIGSKFIKTLRRLRWETRQSEFYLDELQVKRLGAILEHAVAYSEYYRKVDKLPDEAPVKRLKAFPILDKQLLRTEQKLLLTVPEHQLLRQSSSGSSGIQSVVYWTKEEQSLHRATQILWWEWAGYYLGKPILQTGMTPKRGLVKSFKDKLLSTYYMVAFSPSEESLNDALNWALRQNEPFLGGYASSLYILSQHAHNNSMKLSFGGAVSWGDKLFDHYRNSIETAFNTKIYETYGTAEGMMIAAQKDLPYMYIMTPNVYLEILDDEGNEVPDGQMGHVVVTSLHAKGMPLIRYKIGDIAIKLPRSEYPEKRALSLPLLQKVIGRDTDIVKTRSGKMMVVHTFTGIFEHIREIQQFCVIQENLDGVKIQYIPRDDFKDEMLESIKNKIQSYLKEPAFQLIFEPVQYIAPTPSGKPQIIQSFLK